MAKTSYSQYINRYSLRYRVWKSSLRGTTSTIESITTPKLVGQEVKLGWKDPDWRVKLAKQQDASSTYTRKVWEVLVPHEFRCTAWSNNSVGDLAEQKIVRFEFSNHGLAGASPTDDGLRDRALARLKSKLSSSLGNANLMIPTVELRELRGAIRSAADATINFCWLAHRIRKKRRMKYELQLQQAWLTYSFGLAPLISDTLGALEAVNNYLERPRELKRIRSSATKEWQGGVSQIGGDQQGWSTSVQTNAAYKLQYAYVAGIDFKVVCGNNYSMAKHLGFSNWAYQLPGLAWELTAFSWVFDYFTTVGAYLNDTFVLPPGSTVYCTLTRKHVSLLDERMTIVPAKGSAWVNRVKVFEHALPGSAKYIEFDRSILTSLPHRSLRIKSADEIGSHAVNKLLNLAALLKFRK